MLTQLFKTVELPEIVRVDFRKLSHAEIAQLLPSFGGAHPVKAILIDKESEKAFGIASGWDTDIVVHNGMEFKSGAISPDIAVQAGGQWAVLGNHVEPVAAAFMRNKGIKEGRLYINGRNPCWGTPDGTGCYYLLQSFLEAEASLTVYNKDGQDFVASQPRRKFQFIGIPNE